MSWIDVSINWNYFFTNDNIQAVLSPSFRNNIIWWTFLVTLLWKHLRLKAKPFSAQILFQETTTIKNKRVYCCIAGQERTLKNQGNIKPTRFIYGQIILALPEKTGKAYNTVLFFCLFLFIGVKRRLWSGKKRYLPSIFIQQFQNTNMNFLYIYSFIWKMSTTYIPGICLKPKTTAENTTQIVLKTIGQKCSIWLAPTNSTRTSLTTFLWLTS